MANQVIRYVRWVFIHRFVGQLDANDVFVTTKSIQMTKTEPGMQELLGQLVTRTTATHGKPE
jgi:hypothetical protein